MRYSQFHQQKTNRLHRTFKKMMTIFRNIIFVKKVSGLFVDFFRCPGVSKDKIILVLGLVTGSNTEKSWKWGFRAFKIVKSGFYYTKSKQKKSIKALKVLFKHISPIFGPKMARIIAIFFPMMFLWLSCDFSYDVLMIFPLALFG